MPIDIEAIFTRTWLYVTFEGLCYRNPSVVCLSSVTLVHPTQAVEAFGNISSPLCTLATLWTPCKILRRSSQGNSSVVGVKRKRGNKIQRHNITYSFNKKLTSRSSIQVGGGPIESIEGYWPISYYVTFGYLISWWVSCVTRPTNIGGSSRLFGYEYFLLGGVQGVQHPTVPNVQ